MTGVGDAVVGRGHKRIVVEMRDDSGVFHFIVDVQRPDEGIRAVDAGMVAARRWQKTGRDHQQWGDFVPEVFVDVTGDLPVIGVPWVGGVGASGDYPSKRWPMLAHELMIVGTVSFPGEDGKPESEHKLIHVLSPNEDGLPARIHMTTDVEGDYEVARTAIEVRYPREDRT